MAGVTTRYIESVMDWYEGIAIEHREFSYGFYGITDRNSLVAYYSRQLKQLHVKEWLHELKDSGRE